MCDLTFNQLFQIRISLCFFTWYNSAFQHQLYANKEIYGKNKIFCFNREQLWWNHKEVQSENLFCVGLYGGYFFISSRFRRSIWGAKSKRPNYTAKLDSLGQDKSFTKGEHLHVRTSWRLYFSYFLGHNKISRICQRHYKQKVYFNWKSSLNSRWTSKALTKALAFPLYWNLHFNIKTVKRWRPEFSSFGVFILRNHEMTKR